MLINTSKIFYGDCLVTEMFDIYGNDTYEINDAFYFIAITPDGYYMSCECEYRDLIKKKLN
jgi:hypothetical protein